jgi:predicted nucleotidyltransferase component of viral defense system
MNERPDQDEFEAVANEMAINPSFIEKDWFVTQVVAALAAFRHEGFEFIFTGGTALSKAHCLMKRFSEDVDFRVIAPQGQQNRKQLSKFKNTVLAHLREAGFAIEDAQVKARDDNRFVAFEFNYPSVFPQAEALRPHVQIEISVRDTQCPPMLLPVSSFVNKAYSRPPDVEKIACISPVESAADKLSALAWRIPARIRGNEKDDPALVRHIHDLALLKDRALADEQFPALVMTSIQTDENDRRAPELCGLPVEEKFRQMLDRLESDPEYQNEYDTFAQGVSYAAEGEFPDFTTARQAVRDLVQVVSEHCLLNERTSPRA